MTMKIKIIPTDIVPYFLRYYLKSVLWLSIVEAYLFLLEFQSCSSTSLYLSLLVMDNKRILPYINHLFYRIIKRLIESRVLRIQFIQFQFLLSLLCHHIIQNFL